MPRNRVLAILASVVLVTIVYVMWQRMEPPKPVSAPLTGAATASPTDKPNLGTIGH